MWIDTRTADRMQAAVDEVFQRLPAVYKTEAIREELAKKVVRVPSRRHKDYCDAARFAVLGMFASLDRALQNRGKLARPGAKLGDRNERFAERRDAGPSLDLT